MRYLLILLLFVFSSCVNNEPINTEKDNIFLNKKYVNQVDLKNFNDLGKIYSFIKIWGFLKYNADFSGSDINWDEYFLKNINTLSVLDKKAFASFIEKTINLFPKPEVKKNKNKIEQYSLLDNEWFNSSYFNESIKNKLNYIFENRIEKNTEFIDNNRMGNLKFLNEEDYSDTDFPTKDIRLLGLARYWNIINYFYVYKNDIAENWDKVLLEHIPEFGTAKNAETYHLATQQLSSKLYDCHSMVYSNYLDSKVFGRFTPNFRIKRIDSTFVVTHIRAKKIDDHKILPGDIIVMIDNIPVNEKYNKLRKIMRGANPLSEQRIICPYIVSSKKENMELVVLRNGTQQEIKLKLNDYSKYRDEENDFTDSLKEGIVVKAIDRNTSYLNLTYVSGKNFDENIEKVKDSKNLILDLRNQFDPNIIIDLANFILPKKSAFFSSSYSDANRPGLLRITKGYTLGKDNANNFKGNIYVLVDEHTQSSSEFMVMALQASAKTKVIGGQTAGSDGNIVEFNFPGNISTVFTGIGIYYPNLNATQRKGILIDYKIDQTVKGIQDRKDEVLEKCLFVINQSK